MTRIALVAALVVASNVACPAPTSGEGEGEGEGAIGEGEGEGAVGEGEGEGSTAGATRQFPCGSGGQLDTTAVDGCSVDADCTTVLVNTDCCGDSVITGVNAASLSAIQPSIDGCNNAWPACGCAEHPPFDDGGAESADFSASPSVSCVAGTCTTAF